jgi:rhamnogalacturonan endolyase
VRTGNYGFYAWSNGGALGDVYTNFTISSVSIRKGKTTNMRTLTWEVPENRIRVFQIGEFDKKALGFINGGAPRQHGLTEKSPANLTYVVGTSKTTDWYYASSKLGTWSVVFNTTRPSANAAALLSVSLAGYSQSTGLAIYLNGNTTIGTINKDTQASDPALYRSGTTSGEWRFLQYELPTTGLQDGQNVLSFTVDRYTQWRGILWDSVILEWVK